ncbi:4-hydroxy-3-methylbut-2-enyl diphosphate reductase [Siphonobacter aquaeclarae]|uniref:4-hydroxy-3-methylbut-2-enyl diphosphate reductase n=2 Tax=Siphonobacter aquaeclarae TaxID=563176 RepID=A0A1G9M6N3_9BACT|nr:4-hydroxy-3-methylbut-2-enyl diphosphate reductase [Siphonobacter aquaeclarae]
MSSTVPTLPERATKFKKMKSFQIPDTFRSPVIGAIKEFRRKEDKMKKDFTPTVLDFGPVRLLIARHFGFCYGVENAVETAYQIISEYKGRSIYLLSEMIHNPEVNQDLQSQGVRFIMDTSGKQLIPWENLKADDVVIIPAFGTTLEIQQKLGEIGIETRQFDTTCPFVEKVWKRASSIGQSEYTVVIHGKPTHEETRATFSHARQNAPTVVVKDLAEARKLADYIRGDKPADTFYQEFKGQYSEGFDVSRHLQRIGVVNQTTMLASDTQGIADYLRQVMIEVFGIEGPDVTAHFADTRDTLCYATNDNQTATYGLLQEQADLCIVAGGYNSSNTSHLVELCEAKLPTYFIANADKLLDRRLIRHYDLHEKVEKVTEGYLPEEGPVTVMLTCGASCPDKVVEDILLRLLSFFPGSAPLESVMEQING